MKHQNLSAFEFWNALCLIDRNSQNMNLKSRILSLVILGGLFAFTTHQKNGKEETPGPIRKVKQSAFKKGEFLRYDVSYGYFDAAKATGTIKSYGGNPLVRGGKYKCLEGNDFPRTVIWEFPTYEAAEKCYNAK